MPEGLRLTAKHSCSLGSLVTGTYKGTRLSRSAQACGFSMRVMDGTLRFNSETLKLKRGGGARRACVFDNDWIQQNASVSVSRRNAGTYVFVTVQKYGIYRPQRMAHRLHFQVRMIQLRQAHTGSGRH